MGVGEAVVGLSAIVGFSAIASVVAPRPTRRRQRIHSFGEALRRLCDLSTVPASYALVSGPWRADRGPLAVDPPPSPASRRLLT